MGYVAVAAGKGLGRSRPVFPPAMELEIVAHIKRMESMLFGFPMSQLKRVAHDYVEANGVQHNFNRRTGEAGEDWCRDFMARHSDEISLRTPEPTSTARARAFNQAAVNAFFDLLEMVQDAKKFTPDRVYNVDETGITTAPNRTSPVGERNRLVHCRLLRGTTCHGRTLHECCWIIYTAIVHLPEEEDERRVDGPRTPRVNRNSARDRMDAIPHLCDVVRTFPEACKLIRSKTRSFDPRWQRNERNQQPAFHQNGSSQF